MSNRVAPRNPLAPTSFAEAERFARMLAGSELVPREYRGKPEAILVAMQWGYEVGLNPLQALQNIAVINGRPALWGDAALALVRGHHACEYVREGIEGEGDARHGWCEVKRRGEPPQRRTFSVADAKRAGLWGKPGPWQSYPDRMLQLRARGFALRDVFPDALRGVITAEEARDIPAEDPMPASRLDAIERAIAAPAIETPAVEAPVEAVPEVESAAPDAPDDTAPSDELEAAMVADNVGAKAAERIASLAAAIRSAPTPRDVLAVVDSQAYQRALVWLDERKAARVKAALLALARERTGVGVMPGGESEA